MSGIQQIGGYLKALLMGRYSGNEKALAVDADGHLQIDVAFSTGTATPLAARLTASGQVGTSSLASKEDHRHWLFIEGHADGRLTRSNATTIALVGLNGTSRMIEVYLENVSLATNIVLDISTANVVIDLNGDDLGAAAANTLYYVYLANSSASYAPFKLRCSAVAPTNGYLGASGNAINWRHVGWLRTNASTQLADIMAVASAINPIVETTIDIGTGTGTTNSSTGWETVLGLVINVLIPTGWQVIAMPKVRVQHSAAGTLCGIDIYSAGASTVDSISVVTCGTANSGELLYSQMRRVAASLEYVAFEVYTYTGANTATYQGNQSNLIILRIPLIQ